MWPPGSIIRPLLLRARANRRQHGTIGWRNESADTRFPRLVEEASRKRGTPIWNVAAAVRTNVRVVARLRMIRTPINPTIRTGIAKEIGLVFTALRIARKYNAEILFLLAIGSDRA